MSDLKAVAGGARPSAGQPAEEHEPEPAPRQDEIGEALARALVELRAIGRDLLNLAGVGLDRARLGVRAGAFRLLVLSWLALAAAAATIVAAYFFIDGAAAGLGELLGGRVWAGRMVGGGAILALIGAAALVARARSRRAGLQRLKNKYPEREEPR